MPRERVLIVDDEANARTALAELLRDEGYLVETAADGFKALPKLDQFEPDVVITDLKIPGRSGLELMDKIRERDPECVVIVMTAFGAVESAVQAMRQGAADYLTKPVNVEEVWLVLQRELERKRLRAEAGQLRERLADKHRVDNIIGSSPAMQQVFDAVLQVAPSRASVLITGESGTPKELIAAAIHEHSPRSGGRARPLDPANDADAGGSLGCHRRAEGSAASTRTGWSSSRCRRAAARSGASRASGS